MLHSLNELLGYQLNSLDGEIGRCKDFLFDDNGWVVRYMVVDTHKFLPLGKKVLISPISFAFPKSTDKGIPVNLSRQAIEHSPPLDEHQPISREYEIEFFKYYGYAYYWTGPGLWGTSQDPAYLADAKRLENADEMGSGGYLRSIKEVSDYNVQATDDVFGHVKDFIINDASWSIPFLLIDTGSWLQSGKKVLVPTAKVKAVEWLGRDVSLSLNRFDVEHCLEFNSIEELERKSA